MKISKKLTFVVFVLVILIYNIYLLKINNHLKPLNGVKLAIIQMSNQQKNEKVAQSIVNKQEYSLKHNYALFIEQPEDSKRHPKWLKLKSVLKVFTKTNLNDWVWMLDTDTIITNLNIKLDQLVTIANNLNYHMIMSFDCQNINTGSVLFRNSNISINFINQVWETYGIYY
jgi:mannan polymerase II complex MNN10 subunit